MKRWAAAHEIAHSIPASPYTSLHLPYASLYLRWAAADEIAQSIVFLCSEQSGLITG